MRCSHSRICSAGSELSSGAGDALLHSLREELASLPQDHGALQGSSGTRQLPLQRYSREAPFMGWALLLGQPGGCLEQMESLHPNEECDAGLNRIGSMWLKSVLDSFRALFYSFLHLPRTC